jgi:sulfate adenylyltransferase subunit 1
MLQKITQQVAGCHLVTIPVSALLGDNVVDRSQHMPWYDGPTLLEHLESVAVWNDAGQLPFRLAVQRVIRPHQHYRGFAGQISAGTIRVGDLVTALPSGRSSRVTSITTFDGDLGQASAPLSIALTLEEELDISRGDLLAEPDRLPQQATIIEASLVWFDVTRLDTHRPYLLKHGASILNARVTRVLSRTNVETLADEAVATLGMNDIGLAHIALTLPLHFDPYTTNRASGSFILIDPQTNATLAAGMIRRGLATGKPSQHRKAALLIASNTTIDVAGLETALLSDGALVVTTRVADPATLRSLLALGLVVLFEGATAPPDIGDVTTMDLSAYKNSEEVLHLLQTDGVLIAPPGGDHAR